MAMLHLVTEDYTTTVGDLAIYLTPAASGGWDVTAINMMGEVIESESFAIESVARRYVAELVRDRS